ncbi:hypothetical protein IB655_08795 [Francisella noatunensis]|uniref:Uncharacterized protein n=1 Tax=Francisella noatunensis TaxID=657445 RepID=A0A9Q2QJJ6_9GAMM|nr:hypothetical protein [Francisella noatunensis]MBK2028429.1 hypothetical protein [Francisella noatunensis]MBK2029249.1 hypothetical protein [Francisella noatunensis]MBK2029495.1 hypothetical protein [Francisella noatunensis]MBK2034099.1 hypothetical protein [Francisella noatunensis]MBK2034152.1 hypothetical protein [Francisella noatunensis]
MKYFEAHKTDIRDVELENMTNIMSCGLQVREYQQFVCHTKGYHHTKKICFSCTVDHVQHVAKWLLIDG